MRYIPTWPEPLPDHPRPKGRTILTLALAGIVLAGCETTRGASVTCPPLKNYSKEFLAEAAKELEQIGAVAPRVTQMATDYGVTRDAIRACLKRR